MAFRSQRYHLSRGRVEKKRGGKKIGKKKKKERKRNRDVARARRRVTTAAGGGERGAHRCLHSRRSGGPRWYWGVLYARTRVADIAHPEYFMGRVWNKIKFATRAELGPPSPFTSPPLRPRTAAVRCSRSLPRDPPRDIRGGME
jgi:hypothetical protein